MLLKRVLTRLVPALPFRVGSCFSKRAKSAQLILHSSDQIQQMLIRKEEKERKLQPVPKPWKSGVEGESRFRVSLVGLPNCGKSSLFNCLIGERIAIVDPHQGTTRDRKEFSVLNGLVSVIDTPGVETNLLKKGSVVGDSLKEEIFKQCIAAIHESHLIIMVIDAKKPVTRDEIELSQYLKAFGKHAKIILVANKCDGFYDEGEIYGESSRLGLGEPFSVSAETGTGVIELLNFINDSVPQEMKTQFEEKRLKRV
jgi:GTP-binding protein